MIKKTEIGHTIIVGKQRGVVPLEQLAKAKQPLQRGLFYLL
ncbi:hypothetical protein [Paenibacillus sp. Soil766]|nr:hypothetical protein [Paenibacillus sp. Soil766]